MSQQEFKETEASLLKRLYDDIDQVKTELYIAMSQARCLSPEGKELKAGAREKIKEAVSNIERIMAKFQPDLDSFSAFLADRDPK